MKKVLWNRRAEERIDSRSLCLSAGRIFLGEFGRYFACLEARTGREIWRRTAEKDADLFAALGSYRPGHGYIEGWKSTLYARCTDRALYLCGPQTDRLAALAAEDGRLLWVHPVKNLHVLVRPEGLFVIGPERSTGQTRRLDPLTGEILQEYAVSRRACTRSTGGPDGIFFRAYDGTTRLDLSTGRARWISPMRPSCHVGVLTAHGHLYWNPWACDCNLQMFGAIALGPAGDFRFDGPAGEAGRLERGEGGEAAGFPLREGDWPAYRADNARSGRSRTSLPARVRLLWTFSPGRKVEASAPTAAGGRVFAGWSDGVVRSLDAASGEIRWTARTGGAVRFPPAVAGGRAFVGSGDGWAYALEAASGRLLWRFQAAPEERRIPVYGALLSTWPVAAGVIAEGDSVYLAAGINCLDGTHVYALEAATGRVRWHNGTSGHLDAESRTGVAVVQGELLIHDGKLYLAGGNAVSPGIYDLRDGRCLSPAPQGVTSRGPRGRELRVEPSGVTVTGQPFYSIPEAPVYDRGVAWRPVEVEAANGSLAVAERRGPEGTAWTLVARSPSGGPLWEVTLPGEPQRWGVALDASGRVAVALRDGRLVCYGE